MQGASLSDQDWAGVAGSVAHALATHAGQSKAPDHGPALARIERQLAAVPDREYRQHIAAGRRFLQDLPVDWRTKKERARIIRDARVEFVRASAIASELGDVRKAVVLRWRSRVAGFGCHRCRTCSAPSKRRG